MQTGQLASLVSYQRRHLLLCCLKGVHQHHWYSLGPHWQISTDAAPKPVAGPIHTSKPLLQPGPCPVKLSDSSGTHMLTGNASDDGHGGSSCKTLPAWELGRTACWHHPMLSSHCTHTHCTHPHHSHSLPKHPRLALAGLPLTCTACTCSITCTPAQPPADA